MGVGSVVLAAAQRPGLVCGLVLVGPFVRNGKTSAMRHLLLRVAMAPPWAAASWRSYLPKLYAGRRPADFGEYRGQVVASLRRPGYAKAFSRTTRTSHDPAEARLADVAAPALVVMASRTRFPDPQAEADWIARTLDARVVMVPDSGIIRSPSGPTSPPRRPALPGIGQRPCLRAGLSHASRATNLIIAAGSLTPWRQGSLPMTDSPRIRLAAGEPRAGRRTVSWRRCGTGSRAM